ncbi:30S ribosomal protein S6 [filamentous cyanobacterium CCP5]|nr:30S ribosomal protein S6 [filamentous cyanobacterium CCP5]
MKDYMYETMYILRPDIGEDAVDEAIGRYQALLKDEGAELLETQHRGKRRLAYEIDDHRDGIYIQINFTGPGEVVAKLERAMRLSEDVIRYLTVKQEIEPEETSAPPSAAPAGA